MAISLLRNKDLKQKINSINPKTLQRLSLDRSFSYICADVKKKEYFFTIISALTNDKEEIIYRQDITKDFQNNPSLLEELISLYARFEELRITQKNIGKNEYRLSTTQNNSAFALKNILQMQALCLKRALLFIKGFGELLSKYSCTSAGLRNFYNACYEYYRNNQFSELLNFCTKYENFSSNSFFDFKITLNEEGHITEYALIDHKYIHITDPELKQKRFSLLKKADVITYPCARVYPSNNDFYEDLTISALSDLAKVFSNISEQIFTRFAPIYRELDFYDVALKYIKTLFQKNVPCCFPIVSDDKSIKVEKIYDLYLLMSKTNLAEIIPNDFELPTKTEGLVLFGSNGSGKTVYLRSIATMQLLAQAGLPIPCKKAMITLYSNIDTQFSEAEKEFCEDNEAGRFEQEVRELATMVDSLQAGSLVFLNEPFQSTAYAEGAEGLYHLLKYFTDLDIRWVLVSHLKPLEKMFDPNEVKILYTVNKYKIG